MTTLREGRIPLPLSCIMGHNWIANATFKPTTLALTLEQPEKAYCPICLNPDRDIARQRTERGTEEDGRKPEIRIRMEEL